MKPNCEKIHFFNNLNQFPCTQISLKFNNFLLCWSKRYEMTNMPIEPHQGLSNITKSGARGGANVWEGYNMVASNKTKQTNT
jgi:hypothetical protein